MKTAALNSNSGSLGIKVNAIVAVAENSIIGANGKMPWHLAQELKYFKQMTIDKPVIMGRVTYDSILQQLGKPLPQRHSIVLSKNNRLNIQQNCSVASTVTQALQIAKKICVANNVDSAMVIGGSTIYKLFDQYIDKYYLTKINIKPKGDSYFELPKDYKLTSIGESNKEGAIEYEKQIYSRV